MQFRGAISVHNVPPGLPILLHLFVVCLDRLLCLKFLFAFLSFRFSQLGGRPGSQSLHSRVYQLACFFELRHRCMEQSHLLGWHGGFWVLRPLLKDAEPAGQENVPCWRG